MQVSMTWLRHEIRFQRIWSGHVERHSWNRVAFNARGFVHLMQPSEIAAHLMRHTSFDRKICPIRRGKTLSFFSLAAASSTGVHRVTWKKDGFVLLGALFIGHRPDCHVSWFSAALIWSDAREAATSPAKYETVWNIVPHGRNKEVGGV